MNTILKNILPFTGLVVGVPVSIPHRLNVNGQPVAPKIGGVDASGFTVTANNVNVTVTRLAAAPTNNVKVYVEYWHTIESVTPLVPPPGQLIGLTPFFFANGGSGGGGSNIMVEDEGVLIPGNPKSLLNFVGLGVTASDGGGGSAIITIPGGIAGITIEDEGGVIPNNPKTVLNFVGPGVTAADAGGGVATITIPGTPPPAAPSASNVLTFRPGSAFTGPVVFNDFNALYAQFDALRTAADSSGKFKIVFDDQDVGGPGNPVILNSGPGNITYDFLYAELIGVHEDANVDLRIQNAGGESDALLIINALWWEGLDVRLQGNSCFFDAQTDQTFTLTRTTFTGAGNQYVMRFLGVNGTIHLNDESQILRSGVFPAGVAAIQMNGATVTVHANGANCRVNGNAFLAGAPSTLLAIINSSSARFDFDQADVGGVTGTMSTAAGYWTVGAPFTVTDPNGLLTATEGTLISDESTGFIWRNTDGATAWAQLSSGGGTQYVFVYQPGGVAVDNVYTNWPSLYGALSAVKGERLVEFDATFVSPCVIPAGVYALEDVIFTGNWTRPNTDVTFDVGVVTTGLRHIRTSLRITAADPTTAPIADFTNTSNVMLLDDGVTVIFQFPIIDFSGLSNEDQGYLNVRNGSQVLGAVPQPITTGTCTLTVTIDGANSQCGQLAVNPGTGTVIVRVTGGPGMITTTPTNGGQFLVSGAMGQLPAIFVASDFFGATNPDGVVFVVDTSGGPVTCLNMRGTAQCPGSFVAFKKSNDGNALTILPGGGDTIDGLPSYVVATPKGEVTLVSDGVSNWMVLSAGAGSNTATQYAFVYQPGGTPFNNVFDDWTLLMAAMGSVRGPKLLQFDDQFAALGVPPGTWDMTDTVWEGIDKGNGYSLGPTTVQLSDGVVLTKLRMIRGLRVQCVGATAINDIGDGDVFILDDYAIIGGADLPVINLDSVPLFKSATICVRHGSQILQQGAPIVGPTFGLVYVEVDKFALVEPNTFDNGSAASGALAFQLHGGDNITVLQSFFGGTVSRFADISAYNLTFQNAGFYNLYGAVNRYDPSAGAIGVSLQPAAWRAGQIAIFKNVTGSTNTITITPSGADTIDGSPTYTINTAYGVVRLVSDGVSDWMVI